MSVASVNHQIQRALRDRRVTSTEVDSILKATEPSVSNGEAKALANLHATVSPPRFGHELPPVTTTIDREALTKLERFIGEQNLPIGDHKAAMREAINGALARVRLGPLKTELPKSIDKLMALDLAGVPMPEGSWTSRAYIDVAKKRFYLVETRASLQDNTRVWGYLATEASLVRQRQSAEAVAGGAGGRLAQSRRQKQEAEEDAEFLTHGP